MDKVFECQIGFFYHHQSMVVRGQGLHLFFIVSRMLPRIRCRYLCRWAFFVTFGGYFMAHFSRKCYSTVKQQRQKTAGYSSIILSAMDTVFMGTYAAGNIISGKLGDTFNPTTVLAIGLFGSGCCLFLIVLSLWMDILSMSLVLGNFFIIADTSVSVSFSRLEDPLVSHLSYTLINSYSPSL